MNVELRKAKKEDHLLKRRNLEIDDEPLSPLQEQNRMAAANMSIEDIVKERNPPIDILINANVVPKLVEFLSRVSKYVKCLFWFLNIS